MSDTDRAVEKLLASLQERAKELNCLYEVEQVLNRPELPLDVAFQQVVEAIPPGWQYPDVCTAQIEIGDRRYTCDGFRRTDWCQTTDVTVQDEVVGQVVVCYLEERPREDIGPFLKEEARLINTIAERLGHSILYHRLHAMREEWERTSADRLADRRGAWQGPIDLLRRTDRDLYVRIARKMVNHLCWMGVGGAQELLQETFTSPSRSGSATTTDGNVPSPAQGFDASPLLGGRPFEVAAAHLGDDEVLVLIQDWIMEDRAAFLPKILNNPRSTVAEVAESLRRFHHLVPDTADLSEATLAGLRVSLIRRFLTEQLDFISVAKQYFDTRDFMDLLDRVVLSASSHGKLGGKSSGLFLAAKVLERSRMRGEPVGEIRVPRSWYIASEGLVDFIEYNDLEEVLQQKYRDVDQVRHEYPNIVRLFKSSRFPPDVVRGVSMLLDEVGDRPIIVRSSSLLEDRLGSAFSGKYKSLFLANQGDKSERLTALLDAITEVYASVFGPDPIAYRKEKDLLDFHEEMAVLVQEVVGTRVGDWFLPAFAGVAFSRSELRWSPRIRRTDGLLRLVPGLGTRAVDRTPDDYPILAVPGRPGLRVNATVDETVRYSPIAVDALNLRDNRFETVALDTLLHDVGPDYPGLEQVFSILSDDTLRRPVRIMLDTSRDSLVADFGGLLENPSFVNRIASILQVLEDVLHTPVDIEFAHDGRDFYLLQCRPQSASDEDAPAPIPRNVPNPDVVFRATRYVSNGRVPDLTHIVYVDPERYAALPERADYLEVATAVGELNKLLPKRQFVLIGPGRWGSKGDIRLGVGVGYSDLNNTAMLIEIARATGGYRPDLSFGTHFFQDLVESRIRYLPLYLDDGSGALAEDYLRTAPNLLEALLPDRARLADVLHVVDVPSTSGGRILRVLLNSDLDVGLGLLATPGGGVDPAETRFSDGPPGPASESHWKWRTRMAERLASALDGERFGVVGLYLFGSTKNATAGPASDIDLLVHVRADDAQRRELEAWLDGWSRSLAETNYLRTGHELTGLLDVHFVTDDDIARRSSYAAKIGAVTDPARELSLGSATDVSP